MRSSPVNDLEYSFSMFLVLVISNFASGFGDQWNDVTFPFMGIPIVCSSERLLL